MFEFLGRGVLVDTGQRCLMVRRSSGWEKHNMPLLTLAMLDYLSRVDRLHPLGRQVVGVDDLSDGHYFTGRNRLRKKALLARYGDDPYGLTAAAKRLGGQIEPMGEVAYRLNPFPRIPVYYVLWLGDAEFPPRLSILFDRSIDQMLSAPAIWCLVQLCNYYLIKGTGV
jgi:hypothetical protein